MGASIAGDSEVIGGVDIALITGVEIVVAIGPFIFAKAIVEKFFVIPFIDEMVATSHYVSDIIQAYCGRKSQVIHPVLDGPLTPVVPSLPLVDKVTLFTHGRLEDGK